MKTWTRFGLGGAALALAIAAGTGAYAMRGGDDDPPATVVGESRDGDQAQEDSGLGISAVCVEAVPDCVDTVVDVPYDDFGEVPARCAADAVDCVQPGCPPEGCTAGGGVYECATLETDPPTEECQLAGCESVVSPGVAPTDAPDADIQPSEVVEVLPPEEAERLQQAEEGAPGPGAAQQDPPVIECPQPLPACDDPGISACVPPDCAVSSDGSVSCPVPARTDCVPAEPAADDTVSTLPCVVDPCVPGPATDCGVIDCTTVDPEAGASNGQPDVCIPGVAVEPGSSSGGSAGSTGEGESEPAPDPAP